MRIAVIGTGYVGLVAGTGFAENGHQVICVDKDAERIQALDEGTLPFYEPGLEELVQHNRTEERLIFSTGIAGAVADSSLLFLCVGTPETPEGAPDLSQVYAAAEEIGDALPDYRIIVNKSTCPVGTVEKIKEIIAERSSHRFDVVCNPEFMKEGAAVDDFMRPDRIVVGCDDVRVLEIMKELYSPFLRTGKPFLAMSVRSAELSKYAVNSMLAVRISLVNELANIAQAYGADIDEVRQALMADSRVGASYLFPGLGFGGSCLPKDILALEDLAKSKGLSAPVIEGATATNRRQHRAFSERIVAHYEGGIDGKQFGVWGASFKPRTDDLRGAPALNIIDALLKAGARVCVYDPVAGENLRAHYGERIDVAAKMYDALEEADGLVIATEWREFHNPDFERMAGIMREKAIFDGRNLYDPETLKRYKFSYKSVGRPDV